MAGQYFIHVRIGAYLVQHFARNYLENLSDTMHFFTLENQIIPAYNSSRPFFFLYVFQVIEF